MGAPEVVEQLLVCRRLLERVELAAVQVLEQCVAQEVVVVGVLDDRGDDSEVRDLGGAPPALARRVCAPLSKRRRVYEPPPVLTSIRKR